jgi:hypothetical protein
MSHRPALFVFAILAGLPLAAQQPAGKAYTAPRTAWGHPDLQGVYTFAT